MQKINKRYITLGLILISVVFSMYFVIGRYKAEAQYKGYDIVADYNQFLKLSYLDNTESIEYLKEMQASGVTTIALTESTIDSMRSMPNSKLKTEMDGIDLVVKGSKEELDFIIKGLDVLKENREINKISDEEIIIKGRPEDIVTHKAGAYDVEQNRVGEVGLKSSILEYIGLGFDENIIEQLKSNGFTINLRPSFYARIQDSNKTMKRFMDEIEQYNPKQNWIVFTGSEFYSNQSEDNSINEEFINWMDEKQISLGLVEASTQRGHMTLKGVDPVIKNDKVRKIRAFTTWDYLQDRYDYQLPMHRNGEELTNVYYRAISERNISVIFISSYTKNNSVITDPQMYANVLQPLAQRMGDKGYTAGDVKPIGTWTPNNLFKIPVAFGVVAAGVILLQTLFNIPQLLSFIILILGMIGSIGFFGLGIMENTGSLLFNLAAIVIYPSLAISTIMQNYNSLLNRKSDISTFKIYIHGMVVLLVAIIITMIGALNEVAFLSGTNYLMELVEFRGVKISQLLPILISMVIYVAYIGFGREKKSTPSIKSKEIANMLGYNVKFWQAGLAGLLLVIVAIFLLRGGNTNTKVPGFELLGRNLMEIYLPARPRTKAILMGWPAIVMLIYIAYRKKGEFLTLIFILLAAIGMADIVNTFSHIRTPLYISFIRIAVQYAIVAINSLVFVYIAELLRKGYDRYIGE